MRRLRTGPWGQNCYLVRQGRDAVLVDPGGRPEEILAAVEPDLTVHAIFLTHGHFDHVGAVAPVVDATGATVYLSSLDGPVLRQANLLRFVTKSKDPVHPPTEWVDLEQQPDSIQLGGLAVGTLATPGHTPGSHCFRVGNALFTGDVLLAGRLGTAALPGGDEAMLQASVARLMTLDDEVEVYPGHGDPGPLAAYRRLTEQVG